MGKGSHQTEPTTKAGPESAVASKNDASGPWRPFPWCLAPDWVWYAQGGFLLVFISIPAGVMIASTELSQQVCLAFCATSVGRRVVDTVKEKVNAVSAAVGRAVLLDPRNHPYLPWMFLHLVMCPLLAWWAWSRHSVHGFELSTFVLYHFIRLGPRFRFFAHHHVLIHKEGHDKKGFFRGPWKAFDLANSFFAGLFYGTVARSYTMAHNKIHHRWHNDVDDVTTNVDLDRTLKASYVLFLPRFLWYWTGLSPLVLFYKRKEFGFFFDLLRGCSFYYGMGALLCYLAGWQFFVAYFVFPLCESIAFLGAIGYLWHAFVEPTDTENQYVNSITILEGKDNIWNEDYHVVHHHAPSVHWTNMPQHYEDNKQHYASCTATIFRDTEQGDLLYWMFSGKWDDMAEHFVDLNGKLTHEEKKELLLTRLSFRATSSAGLAGSGASGAAVADDWSSWGTTTQRGLRCSVP